MTVNNFTEAARMDLINEILFWICLFVLLWNGYILLFNRGVPNITSSKQVCQAMADILKEDRAAKNKDSYVVYDLGSGNGRLTKKIAREIPDARVVGIEISGLAFWTSKLLKK